VITKVRVQGYRKLRSIEVTPHPKLNILVGENEAGKSTLLEALALALTGRINGRPADEELNPYWFNQDDVDDFYSGREAGQKLALPTISIELFLADRPEFKRRFFGAHNSQVPTLACSGVWFQVVPDEQYGEEIEKYLATDTTRILPVEYYRIDWRTFGDSVLTSRPKELSTAIIDSRTIRSSTGVDYHLRQMLSEHLDPDEKVQVALAYRQVKGEMTKEHLDAVNKKMAELEGAFDGKSLALAMDQSSRTSWDASVVPHVDDVPFGMVGQGQQAAVKISLAVARRAEDARVVMIEEPENHQSHTHLNLLIDNVMRLAGDEQQVFLTTHSSFVLNRLGLGGLVFVHAGNTANVGALSAETVRYFQRLPGYDTLRMVLADKIVLVEGPSDEILFERFYAVGHDGKRPIEAGIDVMSMRGLAVRRCLELARALGKPCAILRDNDGREPSDITAELNDLVSDDRKVFIGTVANGATLEPQLVAANGEPAIREVLGIAGHAVLATWMKNNKTESAMRMAENTTALKPPDYFTQAIEFIDGVK
jgi:hypothetical protein